MPHRIIFHIDMNSYFASVEQQANPHLRGRPVGVCEHLGGLVIAPSIEAKWWGVKTAMPVWEARKLCPEIILLTVDPPKYRYVSKQLWRLFAEYTAAVDRPSIDEAFLDMSHLFRPADSARWSAAVMYGLEIKQRIRREIGEWLSCSIGIAHNRLLAKIAASRDKPDGLTVIKPEDLPALTDSLSLTDIPGIGRRLAQRLGELGIFSIRDLQTYDISLLYERFGVLAYHLRSAAFFHAENRLPTQTGPETIKSLGHAYTLPAATDDPALLRKLIFKLSEKVGRRLRKLGYSGSSASIGVRYASKHSREFFQRVKNLKTAITDGRSLFRASYQLFKAGPSHLPVRMVAVTIAGLSRQGVTRALFTHDRKQVLAVQASDRVNDKYGEFTLFPAAITDARSLAGDTLGFGRIRELAF